MARAREMQGVAAHKEALRVMESVDIRRGVYMH